MTDKVELTARDYTFARLHKKLRIKPQYSGTLKALEKIVSEEEQIRIKDEMIINLHKDYQERITSLELRIIELENENKVRKLKNLKHYCYIFLIMFDNPAYCMLAMILIVLFIAALLTYLYVEHEHHG